jgi:hypothetical protein
VLQEEYPSHLWLPWKFQRVPKGFWVEQANRKRLFDFIGQERQHSSMTDWYSITVADFDSHGGRTMLRHYYNDSPADALLQIYPDHDWEPWRFSQAPKSCWSSPVIQRQFLEALLKEETRDNPDFSWAQLSAEQIRRKGGSGLLDRFNGSVSLLLSTVLHVPESDLRNQRKVSNNFWTTQTSAVAITRDLESRLCVRSPEDWYKVTASAIRQHNGGKIILEKFGSIEGLVAAAYPQHGWQPLRFISGKKEPT